MWRSTSIFIQISILFAFAFTSFLAVALLYVKIQPGLESIKQYNVIVGAIGKMRHYNASMSDIKAFLEEENFHEVKLTDSIKNKISEDLQTPHAGSFNVNVIQDGNKIFITLHTTKELIVYQDPIAFDWSKYHTITMFGAIILIVIYITLMKRLMPLNNIKHEISIMANNNEVRQLTWGIDNQDEIGDLVREFNRSVTKIISISEARTFFLRSIMHELKTPIAKGRIVAEMIDDKKQKQRLCDVFERLNTLIDEFAKIEQLVSKNYTYKRSQFFLDDVIKEAKKMLLMDSKNQSNIVCNYNNDLVKADFSLFALSIKNLLDNAIKYSTDSKAIIDSTGKDLIIKNTGEPLKMDINEYFKPYFKDIKNPFSQGFGLGMYIIKTTLDTQNFELRYSYENGYNIFTIKNCIVENFCNIDSSIVK